MGHERVGVLPRTKRWREIVYELSLPFMSDSEINAIARQTLSNVRSRYSRLRFDNGVRAAFQFLVYLSALSHEPNPSEELSKYGISVSSEPTPVSLTRAVHRWVDFNRDSLEYARIAQCAAGDAIAIWHATHEQRQAQLFNLSREAFEAWQYAGSGSGFCELALTFFAKFTERYLNYFLEREASAVAPSLEERRQIQHSIKGHIEEISKHAFETSKITQSFAAGWFNKHTREGLPSEEAIDGFLAYAFEKMREELLREERAI